VVIVRSTSLVRVDIRDVSHQITDQFAPSLTRSTDWYCTPSENVGAPSMDWLAEVAMVTAPAPVRLTVYRLVFPTAVGRVAVRAAEQRYA
jgi:hypothetical protein